jgi:hypothetical protein
VLCERVEVREADRTDDKNADDERTATADERPNEAIEADRQTPGWRIKIPKKNYKELNNCIEYN